MHWPKVSVIIPSYNQGQFIERTIRSILLQDYKGEREIIVSDGGSTDNTVEVLKSLSGIQWWSRKDRGFADAVNKGLKVATGEVIAIQSSDDYYLQNAFRDAALELHLHPQCVMVSGGEVQINSGLKIVHIGTPTAGVVTSPRALLMWEAYVRQHCTFMHGEALRKLGGLDESVDWCADFDLFYRMLHLGPAVFTSTLYGVYQLHDEQRTQRDPAKWVEALMNSVRGAENHPPLDSSFRPDPAEIEHFEVRHTLMWHETIGGEGGKRFADKYALGVISEKSNHSLLAKEAARKWLWEKGLIPGLHPRLSKVFVLLVRGKSKIVRGLLGWRKKKQRDETKNCKTDSEKQGAMGDLVFWCVDDKSGKRANSP